MSEQHIDYKELGRLYKRLAPIIDYFPPVDTVARHPFRAMYYAEVQIKMMGLNDNGVIEKLEKWNLKDRKEIEPNEEEQLEFILGYYEE